MARQNSILVRIGVDFRNRTVFHGAFSANGEQLKVVMGFVGWRIEQPRKERAHLSHRIRQIVGYLGSGGEIVAMVEAA